MAVECSRARDYNTMPETEAIPNYSMVGVMSPESSWWRRRGAGVAFTSHSVAAFNQSGERRFEARELPAGLIKTSAATPNVQSMGDLARVVEEALDAVGAAGERLAVALPDLAITTAVYPKRGRTSARSLRRELGATLPYPVGEARCDFWRGRHDEVLGAAVRDAVVEQYERIVEVVGCRLGWVDGASLCRIPSWAARPGRPGALQVYVQLYVGHYCLTVFRDGELLDTRTKLRTVDEDDVELVAREIVRAPILHDSAEVGTIGLCGRDAAAVAAELERTGEAVEVRIIDDGEDRQLASSIETLLERGRP